MDDDDDDDDEILSIMSIMSIIIIVLVIQNLLILSVECYEYGMFLNPVTGW